MRIATLALMVGFTVIAGATPARSQSSSSETHRFPSAGFAIAPPTEGWTVSAGAETAAGIRVELRRTESQGLVGASVLVDDVAIEVDAQAARDAAIESLDGRAEYRSHTLLDDTRLGGHVASGVDVAWEFANGTPLRLRLRYVVHAERGYLVQTHAPIDSLEQHEGEFAAVFDSFQLIDSTEAERQELALGSLAARCGSELDWAESWDAGIARARDEGRHLLVVVHSYPSFEIPDSTRISTFMDEDVLALVRERLVPLRLEVGAKTPLDEPNVYGMSPTTFGAALLLVDSSGRVLADTPHIDPAPALSWLYAELARNPEPRESQAPAESIERIELALDRGELASAEELLEQHPDSSARFHLAAARLYRLRRAGPEAIDSLENAMQSDGETSPDIACRLAEILYLEGRGEEARTILESSEHAQHPRSLVALSEIERSAGELDAAAELWQRLVDEHAESRWAWLAAAMLQNRAILEALPTDGSPGWPRADVLEVMAEPPVSIPESKHVRRAEGEALEWLVAHQRADGSWPATTDLHRSDAGIPSAIATAIDALAVRSLLQRGSEYRATAELGLEHLLDVDARSRALAPPPVFMDYTPWSAWAQLELIADAIDGGIGPEAELREFGARLVDDLATRVRKNGGWSYYLSPDAAGESSPEQSISFTTAAATVGLLRARDAGVEVSDELIDGALDCLEAMRGDDGLFAYMHHYPSGQLTRSGAPGAAGRGPACEWALFLGGRSSADRVRDALESFTANSSALDAEVGKALMHAGADGQGCHYPAFDYLMAARALGELPARERRPHRDALHELVLAMRLEDGSFLDTPITGRCYGTAAALLTLHALD